METNKTNIIKLFTNQCGIYISKVHWQKCQWYCDAITPFLLSSATADDGNQPVCVSSPKVANTRGIISTNLCGIYIGKAHCQKCQWYCDAITPFLLALATADDVTQMEISLFVSYCPREPIAVGGT